MDRRILRNCTLLAALVCGTAACGSDIRGADGPATRIRVPPGFTVECVAGPPLVEHPMMGCFDDRGRLFVAESAGVNLSFPELLKQRPHFIRVLEPASRSHFLKGQVFADKLTLPQGVLWHDGALYTAAAPSIWRLADTRGTGVADERRELVTRFSSVGNGADIHGPFLGPDGWLYWTKGRHAHEIVRPDGRVLMKGLGARVFRCRPDGRDVEAVCGGGMDDPVEIAFTPEGEPLVTADIFISRPRRIDAIFYAIEGGVFPHAENVLPEFKRTGDLLPSVGDLGWVAPAGLMRYRGAALGKKYAGNLFSAQFNMHRVQRHVVERDGAGFRVSSEDFLVSTDTDFHPTDVLEDADGSLLVIDTGGWFRVGCPTSQVAKPEVKGAIYRVRRTNAPAVTDPQGLALDWTHATPTELAARLDDPRWVVRDRALAAFRSRPDAARALDQSLAAALPVRARRNAVWAAVRTETPAAKALVRHALADKDPSVRIAAAHGVGLCRDALALSALTKLVVADVPAVRREAATALGRIGRGTAVPVLFEGVRAGGDRFLEHALIYALIAIADPAATRAGLRDPSPQVRRAALIALDQMDGGRLTRAEVTPLLNTSDPGLQKTALQVITARPGWARETVGLLRTWLSEPKLPEERQESLRGALLAFARDPAVQALVARTLDDARTPEPTRLLLLETIARAPIDPLPAAWVAALGRAMDSSHETVARQAVAAVRAAGIASFDERLLRIARDGSRAAELRVAALAAAAPRLPKLEPELFRLLVERLGKDRPALDRLAATEAIGGARLDDGQLEALTAVVAAAGPLEMPHLLAAYEHAMSAAVGAKLAAALGQAPGLEGLDAAALGRAFQGFPTSAKQGAAPLFKRLAADTEKDRARLATLEPVLAGGDAARGRAVFFGTKATCVACHTVRGEGGRVGPDLSRIGSIRTGRDLLEAIVLPSASIVRGYEPYVVATKDGRLHTGVITCETPDAIYLVTAERAEVRLLRTAVESVERGRVSIMPQGLDAQLSRQELGDLIAFLRSLK